MGRAKGVVALILYVLGIVGANWAIKRFGFVPVGFGLLAPAGTYFAGAVLVARDCVQLALGRWWGLAAILIGSLLAWQTSPSLAVASGTAFLLGEIADWTLFTPLRNRGRLALAFLAANVVGLLVDTFVFLQMAFGSSAHWQGTALGKFWVTLPAAAVIAIIRRPSKATA